MSLFNDVTIVIDIDNYLIYSTTIEMRTIKSYRPLENNKYKILLTNGKEIVFDNREQNLPAIRKLSMDFFY